MGKRINKERSNIEKYVNNLKSTFNVDDICSKFKQIDRLTVSNALYEMTQSSVITKLRQDSRNTLATYIVAANFNELNEFLYRPAMQYRSDVSHGGSHCGIFASLKHIA